MLIVNPRDAWKTSLHVMFSDWTKNKNIIITLCSFIHNNIQLKAPSWIQQRRRKNALLRLKQQ